MVLDLLIDSLIDNVKILPVLFLTFLLMEYIEDRMQDGTRRKMKEAGKFGPIVGSVLGAIPQCGFSAAASNLYAGKVITMGTLIAIYLSTSDEMLPIMISEKASPVIIAKIIGLKIVYGMIAGFVVDFLASKVLKKPDQDIDIHHFCEHEHCECGREGILPPAIKHTIKIFLFLLVISFVIGLAIEYCGLETISQSVLNGTLAGPFICGIIGLIPNCASSVFITALYLQGGISFGTLMSGLFVGAGVGILVLFRANENKKENAAIIGILYLLGVFGGVLLNILIK